MSVVLLSLKTCDVYFAAMRWARLFPSPFFFLFLVGLRGVVLVAVALSRRVLIGFSRLVARCY